MKVYTSDIEGVCVLNYVYDAGHYLTFRFHLLSEVGAPWQAQAQEMAERLAKVCNADIKQVELDQHPWYVDALVERT